jgi:hypothetical protein
MVRNSAHIRVKYLVCRLDYLHAQGTYALHDYTLLPVARGRGGERGAYYRCGQFTNSPFAANFEKHDYQWAEKIDSKLLDE